jgi:hypothetical protein
MNDDIDVRGGLTVGVLARDYGVRLLNCSSSGCLLETTIPMDVGTIGSLRVELNGQELLDHIQVVRCHQIQGAGSVYHVGAKFLLTESPVRHTVRHTVGHTITALSAVLPPS